MKPSLFFSGIVSSSNRIDFHWIIVVNSVVSYIIIGREKERERAIIIEQEERFVLLLLRRKCSYRTLDDWMKIYHFKSWFILYFQSIVIIITIVVGIVGPRKIEFQNNIGVLSPMSCNIAWYSLKFETTAAQMGNNNVCSTLSEHCLECILRLNLLKWQISISNSHFMTSMNEWHIILAHTKSATNVSSG